MLEVEEALFGIKDYVANNFVTYVNQVNSAVIDSVVIEDFQCVSTENTSILGNGDRYPLANLYIYDIDFTEDTAGQDLLKCYTEMIVAVKNNSQSQLLRLRMMEALRLLFNADKTAGHAVADLWVKKMTPFAPNQSGVAGCLVRFEAYIYLNR